MTNKKAAIILAAGQGTRMRSGLPKVLHVCAELPLICHVVKLALAEECNPIVVVINPQGTRVRELLSAKFPNAPLRFAVQEKQAGTGDAARAGMTCLTEFAGDVLILYGDVPLLTQETLQRLAKEKKHAPLALLSAKLADPTGYGRVVRDAHHAVAQIVEHKDATPEQRTIQEVNVGVYLCDAALLRQAIGMLNNSNAQGEYYLTDIVELAARSGGAVSVVAQDSDEVRGVNSQAELADAEKILRRRVIAHWQRQGVAFRDPDSTFVGLDVEFGQDVVVGFGVQLYGKCSIGDSVHIEGPSVVRDTSIAADSHIYAFSHLEQAVIERGASIGPYARLRPAAHIGEGARVGNFVEVKKSHMAAGSKANHLAYIGDAEVGAGANIGAGTITCNYDGTNKHVTQIGTGAFIGSNSTLVAPVDIGAGAYVAAGSTVTHTVPVDALAFGRAKQVNRADYGKSLRAKQQAKKNK